MDYNTVSFPGLGIGEFTINPTAFKITENITIEWYAIIICAAIFIAYFVCDRLAKRFEIDSNDILDGLLVGLPAGFVGARVWYILGDLKNFDSFIDMISVWNGGLAIYGGIFGACLATFFVCRHKRISFLNLMDLVGIGFMIGQIIGRWGNFANVEVFGVQTDLPWRMGVGVDCIAEYVHPLFLYESLWNLLGLLIIFAYMDSRKFNGELFFMYCAWYGIGRAWMEPLRDTAYNLKIFGVRVNLVLAIVVAIAAIASIIVIRIKQPVVLMIDGKYRKEPKAVYESQFDYAMNSEEDSLVSEEDTLSETEESAESSEEDE
ncbi:MAG: prolipoprotein diacylglyceryl transferase [Clostridia bacterium]|nr:prolipoprotein diacylglyceryl transferase [Clostridia bacterium]